MSQPLPVTPGSPAALINQELSWLGFARRVLAHPVGREPNRRQTDTPSVRLRHPDDPRPPACAPAAGPGWRDVCRTPQCHPWT